eukprot:15463282-Alexandrium_andersonii.AAC.1
MEVAIKGYPLHNVYHTTMCKALQAVSKGKRKYIKHCLWCSGRIRISTEDVERGASVPSATCGYGACGSNSVPPGGTSL